MSDMICVPCPECGYVGPAHYHAGALAAACPRAWDDMMRAKVAYARRRAALAMWGWAGAERTAARLAALEAACRAKDEALRSGLGWLQASVQSDVRRLCDVALAAGDYERAAVVAVEANGGGA